MIILDYPLLISTSMTSPFHCYSFWKHDKWWRHETWWHIRSLQWENNWGLYWEPYIFIWKLWNCHFCLAPWKYSLPIFVLWSLGFGGDTIFLAVNNINAKGRFTLKTLVCAHEFIVDMVCTYGFPPIHDSSFSFRLICLV